ncbi:MAG: hypothetical protein EOM72_04635 [Opitutae bacterium]|nr:hypothetical protein [Opitutae bacterium]
MASSLNLPRGALATAAAACLIALAGCGGDDEASGAGTLMPGFRLTVYYTPVESFHGGAPQTIQGCTSIGCESGIQTLGAFPAGFLSEVQLQGSGRITSGAHAGQYLHGSFGGGFWIGPSPFDAYGSPLRAFETAAADDAVLPRGTRFKLVAPLTESGGAPLPAAVANRLLSATWDVQDHFEAGYGGARHLDLYVGEQEQPHFASSPFYLMLVNQTIAVF